MKKTTVLILLFTLLVAITCGCNKTQSASAQIYALDTVIDITAYGNETDTAVENAKAEIYRLEKLLSVTNENSDIYKINESQGNPVSIDKETYNLIEDAIGVSVLTDGRFDISLYKVLKLWGFTTKQTAVPDKDDISEVMKATGFDKIELSENETIRVNGGVQLDLGGIAKGYIADKAAEAMESSDIDYGIISLGGNIRTIGEKPDGNSFIIGIKHPESNSHFIEIKTDDCSVITSGGYQRNFTENGITYHHIIDPDTGYPAKSDAVSVTVIGTDGTLCDGLSTALFIGGTEYAQKLYETEGGFEYVILTEDNSVYASEGLKGRLTLTESFSNLKIEYR